jgi:hypothetical protein
VYHGWTKFSHRSTVAFIGQSTILITNVPRQALLLFAIGALYIRHFLQRSEQDRGAIVFDRRLRMVRPQSARKAQLKTILTLIVGLMLAGCGSMENHVRNHGVASASQAPLPDPGDTIAVNTICACP